MVNIDKENLYELISIEHQIKVLKNQLKELEKNESALKDKLVGEMEYHQISLFENEEIKVSISPSQKRKIVDVERLKAELPEVYEKYCKESITKSTTRITLKGGI